MGGRGRQLAAACYWHALLPAYEFICELGRGRQLTAAWILFTHTPACLWTYFGEELAGRGRQLAETWILFTHTPAYENIFETGEMGRGRHLTWILFTHTPAFLWKHFGMGNFARIGNWQRHVVHTPLFTPLPAYEYILGGHCAGVGSWQLTFENVGVDIRRNHLGENKK